MAKQTVAPLQSMTSFGRSDYRLKDRAWSVEIRTVNHRFLDFNIRLPRQFYSLEDRVRQEIGKVFSRGRVEVTIDCAAEVRAPASMRVNMELAREYRNCLNELGAKLDLAGTIDMPMIAGYKDVIVPVFEEDDLDETWKVIQLPLQQALAACVAMRGAEGEALKGDMLRRLDSFAATVGEIQTMIPGLVVEKQANLKARLQQLLDGNDVDPLRLAQEVAVIADKSDVTEELVRLHSHLAQFAAIIEQSEPVGRRLDFLLQEFLREVNTIASKIGSSVVAHKVVELKNELEKIREQVQNLE